MGSLAERSVRRRPDFEIGAVRSRERRVGRLGASPRHPPLRLRRAVRRSPRRARRVDGLARASQTARDGCPGRRHRRRGRRGTGVRRARRRRWRRGGRRPVGVGGSDDDVRGRRAIGRRVGSLRTTRRDGRLRSRVVRGRGREVGRRVGRHAGVGAEQNVREVGRVSESGRGARRRRREPPRRDGTTHIGEGKGRERRRGC